MNLADCRVPYIALPIAVLKLRGKTELLHAIELYHFKTTDSPSPLMRESLFAGSMSPYQRRQRREVLSSLERAGVIRECEDSDAFELLPLADTTKDRITIPAQFDYASLSLVAIKAALACHAEARYSRTPFRFITKQVDLAKKAGITERRLRDALAELERKHYLRAAKKWRDGTQITLHEPGSDVPLYYLGEYQQQRVDVLPVCERYRLLLAKYDPKQKLVDIKGPVRSYRVFCPYCKCHRDNSPTFTFTSEDDDDRWACYNCRRSGDSYRLWARWSNWPEQTDWKTIIADICSPPSAADFTFDLGSGGDTARIEEQEFAA
jgi:hypothetical protein